jgi:hypothetical protein
MLEFRLQRHGVGQLALVDAPGDGAEDAAVHGVGEMLRQVRCLRKLNLCLRELNCCLRELNHCLRELNRCLRELNRYAAS